VIGQRHDQGSGSTLHTPPRDEWGRRFELCVQLEWHDRYSRRAVWCVLWRLFWHRQGLRALARRRLIEGYKTYGDSMYSKAEMFTDLDEELGDAIVYAAEHIRRRHS
jgi:hypothetical protein